MTSTEEDSTMGSLGKRKRLSSSGSLDDVLLQSSSAPSEEVGTASLWDVELEKLRCGWTANRQTLAQLYRDRGQCSQPLAATMPSLLRYSTVSQEKEAELVAASKDYQRQFEQLFCSAVKEQSLLHAKQVIEEFRKVHSDSKPWPRLFELALQTHALCAEQLWQEVYRGTLSPVSCVVDDHSLAASFLLDKGTSPNVRSGGWSMYQHAVYRGNAKLAEKMLNCGACVDDCLPVLLEGLQRRRGVRTFTFSLVSLLQSHPGISPKVQGYLTLHEVSVMCAEGVSKALAAGVPVTFADAKGDTALHYLVHHNLGENLDRFTEVFELLVKHGADVNGRGHGGNTVLHTLASDYKLLTFPNPALEKLTVLKAAGANAGVINDAGRTAFEELEATPHYPVDHSEAHLKSFRAALDAPLSREILKARLEAAEAEAQAAREAVNTARELAKAAEEAAALAERKLAEARAPAEVAAVAQQAREAAAAAEAAVEYAAAATAAAENAEGLLEVKMAQHTCQICMDRPREVVMLPCNHMFMCAQCAGRLPRNPLAKCPLCRCPIHQVVQVLMS